MNRLAAVFLVSVLSASLPAANAQWAGPQPQGAYPPAVMYPPAPAVNAYGQRPLTPSSGPSLQANGAFTYQPPACATGDCGRQRSCLQAIKDFVCYYPTAGDALPKLHVHPFTGPWVGTFYATPGPGGSCGPWCGVPNKCAGGCKGAEGSCPSANCAKGAFGGGSIVNGQSVETQGFPQRGCQGGSVAPVVTAPNQFAPQFAPHYEDRSDLGNLPQTTGYPLEVHEPNPELPSGSGADLPVVPSVPQSKRVIPVVPSVAPASTIGSAQKPAEHSDVVQVEFRAAGSAAAPVPTSKFPEPVQQAVGAPVTVKPITSPLDLFIRP